MEIWLGDLNEAPMGKFNMAADWPSKYIQIISKSIPKAQLEPLIEQAEHGFRAPGGLVLWHYHDLRSILHVPWDAPWCHLSLLQHGNGRIPPGHDPPNPPRSSSLDTWPSPLGSKKRKMAVQRCFSSFPTAQRHAAAGHQVGDAIKKESSKEGMGKN